MTPIINCSCQRTTKGVNNALMQAFLLERPIGGGRLSTMGWMIPNFSEGESIGDSGFGVSFVQICVRYTFFCLMRPMTPQKFLNLVKKIDLDPYY